MESTTAPSATTETVPDAARVRVYDLIINCVGFQILGILGILANVFILIVIRKNKNLQSSCFLLICAECVCSIFLSGNFMAIGVREAAFLTGTVNIGQPRLLCYISVGLFGIMAVQGGNLVANCVATDRLISIFTPILYRQMGKRYVKVSWAVCFTYAVLSSISGLLERPSMLTDMVNCTNTFSAVSVGYMAYFGTSNVLFSGLCIVLYAAMLTAFVWKKKTIRDPTAAQAFVKQQRGCMSTVKLLMVFYGISSVLPEIWVCIVSSSNVTSVYVARTVCYVGLIKGATSLAQIVALYFGSKRFRKCAKTQLGIKAETAVVSPMTDGANMRGIGRGPM